MDITISAVWCIALRKRLVAIQLKELQLNSSCLLCKRLHFRRKEFLWQNPSIARIALDAFTECSDMILHLISELPKRPYEIFLRLHWSSSCHFKEFRHIRERKVLFRVVPLTKDNRQGHRVLRHQAIEYAPICPTLSSRKEIADLIIDLR